MAMAANNQDDQFDAGDGNSQASFKQHSQRMKIFSESHSGVLRIGDKSAGVSPSPKNIRTFRVALTVSETGGSVAPAGNADWLSVVPMWKMVLRRFLLN